MPDATRNPPPYELSVLADLLGGSVRGDRTTEIRAIRSLENAGPNELALVARASARRQAIASEAGAVLIASDNAESFGGDLTGSLLVVSDPSAAFAELLELFHPPREWPSGVDSTAHLAADAVIDESAHIGPFVVIGEGTRIGSRAVLLAHSVVGRDCDIGPNVVLHPHVVLYDRTEIGEHTAIHSGVVLGADGFGYATSSDGHHRKIPQVGRTVISDRVEIGANSAVDRATLDETRIGAGSKLDNLVQVGHNVSVGKGCILCGQVGIAGSARLGDGVVLAGQSGVAGHIELGDGVQVAAKSAALSSVPAGRKVAGVPAIELSSWRRMQAAQRQLGELRVRVRRLERSLAATRDSLEEKESGE